MIATITLARTSQEESVLLDSLEALARSGERVFVADGGSRPEFLDEIGRNFKVTVATGGLVAQVKAALGLALATGSEFVVYTEPDKKDFFEAGLGNLTKRTQTGSDADVVVASRDPASFATFPAGQQRIERLFKELAAGFGFGGDLLYGPLGFRVATLRRYLSSVPDDLGWGWRPYLMARCLAGGGTVASHEGFFPCPQAQRSEDGEAARLYRLEQLSQNVRGLLLGLKAGRS